MSSNNSETTCSSEKGGINNSDRPNTDNVVKKLTFNVVRTLGEGAFGEVKLLMDSKNPNFAVAVKFIDIKKDPDIADTVRKEALLQRKLRNHPNIINYIGMRVASDSEFQIFLEYADGGELFDRIEPDYGMVPAKAQHYFRQLIEGVKFIHSNGIAHRDIKPENILLTKNDVLKISDFGMATVFRHQGKERFLTTRCGTPPYVSPQVIEGKYRGEATDIWSCGVVLVTLLAGELPWERPEKFNACYLNWIRGTDLDDHPWKKIDNIALSLLRIILNENEEQRATVSRIQNHPWYIANLANKNGIIFAGCTELESNSVVPVKRRRFAVNIDDELSSRQQESVSQPACSVSHSSANESITTVSSGYGTSFNTSHTSFSQPEDVEALLLNSSQIEASQTYCSNPLQLLVHRMTRFCVTVSSAEAVECIVGACEASGFLTKKRSTSQLTISDGRDMTFIVAVFEMPGSTGKKVLVDFRRSHGDGIEFKRAFVALKRTLGNIICKRSTDWLEQQGLLKYRTGSQFGVTRNVATNEVV